MTTRITVDHNEGRLAGTRDKLDFGTNNAKLLIYGGSKPSSILGTVSAPLLASIELTKPCGTISGGVLSLTALADGMVSTSGVATWAQFVDGNGLVVMDADCSDMAGAAEVKLVATQLYAGGDARLISALIG